MKNFCKVFYTDKYDQILVKIDHAEDGTPEVRFYIQPDNLGVCSIAAKYDSTDDGWDKAEAYFEKIDEPLARANARLILNMIGDTVEVDNEN